MKALEILKVLWKEDLFKDFIVKNNGSLTKFINEAIRELEALETKIIEQDEALAVDRLMNQKLQERNRELGNQIALNNPFKKRSCDNCKKWVGNAPFRGFCSVTGSSCCLGGCNDYWELKK
jgi:hypothetical protein